MQPRNCFAVLGGNQIGNPDLETMAGEQFRLR
jgi:hypothetical protein